MTRDMTDNQFYAALKRNGWRLVLAWITRPHSTLSVGLVMKRTSHGLDVNKRSSIAKAHRLFKEHDRNNKEKTSA